MPSIKVKENEPFDVALRRFKRSCEKPASSLRSASASTMRSPQLFASVPRRGKASRKESNARTASASVSTDTAGIGFTARLTLPMSDTLSLVEQVKAAMKAAMKAREKETLATIRLIQAEFKRVEVDERIEVDDARALAIMDKMVKQRRDSASQYRNADRPELADVEDAEIAVIQTFLPAQLSADEIDAMIDEALAGIDAEGMAAMGPLMGKLKPQLQGRADMGEVSQRVKAKLGA